MHLLEKLLPYSCSTKPWAGLIKYEQHQPDEGQREGVSCPNEHRTTTATAEERQLKDIICAALVLENQNMPFLSPKGEPLHNPYELLKLQHGATDDDISRAFKKLMLQLHPDKQPLGQSAEEAEAVARLMHDVMDAKSFLLDGEYLAARRQYDSMLVLAKQQPPPLPSQQKKCAAVPQQTKVPAASQQTKVPVAPQKQSAASSGSAGIHMSSTSKGRSDRVNELNRDGGKSLATKSGVTPSAKQLNNHVNVKRWGKVKRSRAIGRAAQAKKQDLIKKTNPRSTGKAFDDSCGDCSTTDDNMASDDEMKRTHAHLKTANVNNTNKTNSNRPSKTQQSIPKPSTSNIGGKQNSHVSGEKKKSESGIHPAPASGRGGSERTRSLGREQAVPKPTSGRRNSDIPIKSDPVILGSNKTVGDTKVRQEANRRSSDTPELMKNEYKPAAASKTDFHSSCPTILLEKHYHCPLTKEIMKEPMCDAEGNTYERKAILKYLETHNKSPITGNALSPIDLFPNTALAEKIRLALETFLDSLRE